jgi:hypothetical protein
VNYARYCIDKHVSGALPALRYLHKQRAQHTVQTVIILYACQYECTMLPIPTSMPSHHFSDDLIAAEADTVHIVRPASCSQHEKEIQNDDYGVVQLCAACRVGKSFGREICTVSVQHASAKGCQARPGIRHSHTQNCMQVRALCAVGRSMRPVRVGLVLIVRSLFVGSCRHTLQMHTRPPQNVCYPLHATP